MCGIIGYSGPRLAAPVLVESLRRLEYRGYDSAGIAVLEGDGAGATMVKSERKVDDLVRALEREGVPEGHLGIGHTRWATHGRPTVVNAHPHVDCSGRSPRPQRDHREPPSRCAPSSTVAVTASSATPTPRSCPPDRASCYRGDLGGGRAPALAGCDGAYAMWSSTPTSPT